DSCPQLREWLRRAMRRYESNLRISRSSSGALQQRLSGFGARRFRPCPFLRCRFRKGPLALATPEDQGEGASSQQNNTYSRGQFLATLGLNSDLSISNLHTMVLAVRYGHDESQQSKHQQQDTDDAKVLHAEAPVQGWNRIPVQAE